MSFVYGHNHMGEIQVDGKRYFLKCLKFEEFTDSGQQTWIMENIDTGEEIELEFLPNQKHRHEHQLRMRQYAKDAHSWVTDELLDELKRINHD